MSRLTVFFLLSSSTLLLAGCGSLATFPDAASITPATASSAVHGSIHGGQAPIAGAHIHLMAAGTSGYGSASTSLLNPTGYSDSIGNYVPSGPTGAWSISTDYTCTAGQIVYILATEGNPGLPDPLANNSHIALMAVLGPCPGTTFSSGLSINIDEATTVAGAYALAGFMPDATHLAYSGTLNAYSGILNAAANAGYLVDPSTGKPLATTPNTFGTVPFAELSTLSNLLAYCVNSDGTTNCSSLFALTPNSSNVTPSDTLTSILNIAHNPGANVAALWSLVGAAGDPFPGSLTTQPSDWSVEIAYPLTNAGEASSVAVDASGDVWIPGLFGALEYSPAGALLKTQDVFTSSSDSIAISPTTGTVWFAGSGIDNVSHTALDYTASWQDKEMVLAMDKSGNAWVGLQRPPGIVEFNASGSYITSIPYTPSGFSGATNFVNAIAVDSQTNIWAACLYCDSVVEMSSSGTTVSPTGGNHVGTQFSPSSIAIDSSDNAWIVDEHNGFVLEYDHNSNLLSGSGYPSTALNSIRALAIDGNNNVWVSGYYQGLYELNPSGTLISPGAGYNVSGNPAPLAVDGSGNVWILDYFGQQLGEVIGIATPVVTPINPAKLATRP